MYKKEKTIEETNWGKSLPEQKTKHILSAHSLESVFLFLGNTLSLSISLRYEFKSWSHTSYSKLLHR